MEKQVELKKPKIRESNIELLRILAMIMIIAHHFACHSNFDFPLTEVTFNRVWIQFMHLGGKIGVDVFVLISGYFLINQKEIKVNKVLKIWLQVLFYSMVSFFVFMYIGLKDFSAEDLLHHLLPITYKQSWFAGTYLVLYILSPYINILLNSLDKKAYKKMLIIMTIFWCIIPTITDADFEGNKLIWFVYLYALAGYIKLYVDLKRISCIKNFALVIFITLITMLITVGIDYLGIKNESIVKNVTKLFEMERLPILLISVCLFKAFLKLNIGRIRIINWISSATFGVYLLHDNEYMREFFWKKILKCNEYQDSPELIKYSIIVVFTIFVVCTIIELIRKNTIERLYMKLIDFIINKINIKRKNKELKSA